MQDSETTSLSVGIDIVEVPRIGQALARWGSRFRERVFTPNEQAECAGRVHSLAARFAAKEAAAKALGTGIGAIRWQDVEVICDRHGKPHLHLRGAAREIARRKGLREWAVSLSHTQDNAIAMVVAAAATGPRNGDDETLS